MKIFFKSPRFAKLQHAKDVQTLDKVQQLNHNKIEQTEDQDTYDPEHSVGGQGESWVPESSRNVNRIKMNNIQIV